jgi:hypothetical protein
MTEWLSCPTLDASERGLIEHLKASTSVEAFRLSSESFFNAVPTMMLSAITKARAAGIGRKNA